MNSVPSRPSKARLLADTSRAGRAFPHAGHDHAPEVAEVHRLVAQAPAAHAAPLRVGGVGEGRQGDARIVDAVRRATRPRQAAPPRAGRRRFGRAATARRPRSAATEPRPPRARRSDRAGRGTGSRARAPAAPAPAPRLRARPRRPRTRRDRPRGTRAATTRRPRRGSRRQRSGTAAARARAWPRASSPWWSCRSSPRPQRRRRRSGATASGWHPAPSAGAACPAGSCRRPPPHGATARRPPVLRRPWRGRRSSARILSAAFHRPNLTVYQGTGFHLQRREHML